MRRLDGLVFKGNEVLNKRYDAEIGRLSKVCVNEENKTIISINQLLSYTAVYTYKINMKLRYENKE